MTPRKSSPHTYWYDKYQNTKITILCMLPNGICKQLINIQADLPLEDIKNILWATESKYLNTMSDYVFVVVSSKGGTEELVDEKLSLFDVKPVRPYLKVVKKQGDEHLKKLNSKISMLIGQSISMSKHEEVADVQKALTDFCARISSQRGRSSWYRRAIYTYPPDFEEETVTPKNLTDKYPDSIIHLSISVLKNSSNVFEVHHSLYPSELIEKALRKRAQTLKQDFTEKAEEYMLKVVGSESYFLGTVQVMENGEEQYREIPLIQYKYIRECLIWDKRPMLVIIKREDLVICSLTHTNNEPPPPLLPKSRRSRRGGNPNMSLWNLDKTILLKVKIVCAMDLNSGTLWEEVRCGVFHGGHEVCETKITKRKKGSAPVWNEFLEFDLPVAELPRMARLCFCIVGYQQQNQHRKPVPIAWVNFPLFNYKGTLHTGSYRLYCWHSNLKVNSSYTEDFFNPLGTVIKANDNGPCLAFELIKFTNTVVYPSEDIVFETAAKSIEGIGPDGEHPFLVKGGKQHREQIVDIIKRDSLASMFEQDKELLWKLRADCCLEYPESLPKLLQCVKWSNHEHVAQVHFLLQSWRCDTLQIDIALELLDYKFPDLKVRQLAVQVLDNISDTKLEMYLLHLVQALKYESYLDSPLARYLLRRALNNRRIGHYLFWHLKADVSNPEFSLQFGLLLELYCHGAVEHIDSLLKQVEAINKMKTVTEILKGYRDQDREKKIEMMRQCFEGYTRSFTDLLSPLDPRKRLKKLRVGKCKYMDSKKKPLWLVFENYDDGADDVLIIFKNGDDLRQDMLTLLSLRLMDNVWKSSGLDYGMIPYRCLSTGPMVGLIEVVVNSETLGRIQASKGFITGVWKSESLFEWLKLHCNNNEEKLEMFIKNFARSVVGYSVAMYVLGVGDRHNDNIMMKYDTGQLFHIDFGHFLGNFKSKFGFKRERVKFVLTSDIVYVIQKSKDGDTSENFNRFKEMCIEAFTCLRSRGNLFITVFAMLLSTGIPELEHPNDLDYLRDSLALLKDEPDAIAHFSDAFDESYRKRGSTTANFMFHNVKHNWSN